jgi:hypothetical protein
MAMTPSIGDILMLSQTAWRIGRAFTQGKKSAPAEFAEVEREADGLSEALQLVSVSRNVLLVIWRVSLRDTGSSNRKQENELGLSSF